MAAPDEKMPDGTTWLDPQNPFEAILIKMVETHRKKKADYAGDFHPNQNFYDTGRQLQLTAGHAVEALISTKQARLRVLLPALWSSLGSGKNVVQPQNESIEDTLLDRAVYSVLALTIYRESGYLRDTPPRIITAGEISSGAIAATDLHIHGQARD